MELNTGDLASDCMHAWWDINDVVFIPKNRLKSTRLYYLDAFFHNESAPFTRKSIRLNPLDRRRYFQEFRGCPKRTSRYRCSIIRDDTVDGAADNPLCLFLYNNVTSGILTYRAFRINHNRMNGCIKKCYIINQNRLNKSAKPQVSNACTLKSPSADALYIGANCDAIKVVANTESPIVNYFQAIREVYNGEGMAALKSILPNFNKPLREYNFFQILTISEAVVRDTADSFRNFNLCKTKTFFKCPFPNFSQRGWQPDREGPSRQAKVSFGMYSTPSGTTMTHSGFWDIRLRSKPSLLIRRFMVLSSVLERYFFFIMLYFANVQLKRGDIAAKPCRDIRKN